MAELKQLDRETIIRAITEIRQNPKKRNGRESTTYDLVFDGKSYPPILVLSEANKLIGGEELTLSDFNNNTDKAFSILRDFNFEITPKTENPRIQERLISEYKNLVRNDHNKDELYKWELIQEFQEKWNIEANDFGEILQNINFGNLVDYRSLLFINSAKNYPEEARSLFKMLYDENIPLKKRIADFGENAEQLLNKVEPDKGAFQDERTIATYLTFRYPDKYTFYKYSIYSDFIELLNIDKEKAGDRYIHYLSLIDNFINDYIKNDAELIELSRSTLTEDCFIDDNYNILAQDILYRTTQQNNDETDKIDDHYKFNPDKNNAWIEKTLVKGRPDRKTGEYSLGNRLWSPRAATNGADIYSNMRKVKAGDLILHLTDNEGITGLSLVSDSYKEGKGIEGTDWEGEAYLIELKGFKNITPISREKILNQKHESALLKLNEEYDVFYTKYLNLRQGAYLTECPTDLLRIINHEYARITNESLPYLSSEYTINGAEMDLNRLYNDLNNCGLIYSEQLASRFTTALTTKPFLILTGLSGSGKTKLAQAFANWILEDDKQLNLVPVGADWTNREPLLGYPNALEKGKYVLPESGVLQLILIAEKNPKQPYFLILDEMNLSHVERYFADFLSAIESKEEIKLHSGSSDWVADGYQVPSTLPIPENLFIIGTVNIDETTYMFSPKVLDRANVIEFRVSQDELAQFLTNPAEVDLSLLEGKGAGMAQDFVKTAVNPAKYFTDNEKLSEELLKFFKELSEVGAEFGYRTAFEINRFASLAEQLSDDWEFREIMDSAIAQKLLPKLHGSRRKLEKVLFRLGDLCYTDTPGECKDLFKKHENITDGVIDNARYPVSFEKIVRMHKGLIENGFTSFAEA